MGKVLCSLCTCEIRQKDDLITCVRGFFSDAAYHKRCYDIANKTRFHDVSRPLNKKEVKFSAIYFTVMMLLITIIFKEYLYLNLFLLFISLFSDFHLVKSWLTYERNFPFNKS
ncbi:hypothetical protein Q428_07195 [Fervidicella metallireducens AeB]|uniref:Uncharacterized protein n=1 Tax=Fervidicella metallireducens AeB TaxID=1403537 RepID=A0A017RW24_9CLOT|nr:hypothetical protein [Fervidicella metallireducens]EYE88574.1 hypothetical protein Q428_07195 [Fervidicella metallireducens AeB]